MNKPESVLTDDAAVEIVQMAMEQESAKGQNGTWRDFQVNIVRLSEQAIRAKLAEKTEPDVWVLKTGHGTAFHLGAIPPVEGVGWSPRYAIPPTTAALVEAAEKARKMLGSIVLKTRDIDALLDELDAAIEAHKGKV